ncbi:MAG: hypothetical protein OEL81_01770 [Nitrosopumilus sp.]|nr:hypothetical protein [Nitrosopumilus sp.]
MIPLVKFGLFDTDLNSSLSEVQENVIRVNTHLQKWKFFCLMLIVTSTLSEYLTPIKTC